MGTCGSGADRRGQMRRGCAGFARELSTVNIWAMSSKVRPGTGDGGSVSSMALARLAAHPGPVWGNGRDLDPDIVEGNAVGTVDLDVALQVACVGQDGFPAGFCAGEQPVLAVVGP